MITTPYCRKALLMSPNLIKYVLTTKVCVSDNQPTYCITINICRLWMGKPWIIGGQYWLLGTVDKKEFDFTHLSIIDSSLFIVKNKVVEEVRKQLASTFHRQLDEIQLINTEWRESEFPV